MQIHRGTQVAHSCHPGMNCVPWPFLQHPIYTATLLSCYIGRNPPPGFTGCMMHCSIARHSAELLPVLASSILYAIKCFLNGRLLDRWFLPMIQPNSYVSCLKLLFSLFCSLCLAFFCCFLQQILQCSNSVPTLNLHSSCPITPKSPRNQPPFTMPYATGFYMALTHANTHL